MLGSFRLLLATMVVCFHLAQGTAPVGFIVASLALSGRPHGVDLLLLSIVPILIVAYVLAYLAERFVEPLRTRIRLREAT